MLSLLEDTFITGAVNKSESKSLCEFAAEKLRNDNNIMIVNLINSFSLSAREIKNKLKRVIVSFSFQRRI